MTDEELAAIKAREEQATYGPWATHPDTWSITLDERPSPIVYGNAHYGVLTDADADFIAHARADIPALLAEVEAWRAIGRVVADSTVDHAYRMREDTPMTYVLVTPSDAFDPVWQARALLGQADHDATSTDE